MENTTILNGNLKSNTHKEDNLVLERQANEIILPPYIDPDDIALRVQIVELLKSLKFGDITHSPLPTPFCLPYSLLECNSKNQLNYVYLLLSANQQNNPIQRFLLVLRYIFSTIPRDLLLGKKPFNSILGEFIKCRVIHTENNIPISSTEMISEQISHHPPIAASYIQNSRANISVFSISCFEANFFGTYFKVTPVGYSNIWLHNFDEEYVFSFPNLYIRPFRWKAEWCGTIQISCQKTCLEASLKFKEKPIYQGHWNEIEGTIYQKLNENKLNVLYKIEGIWDQTIKIYDAQDNDNLVYTWKKSELTKVAILFQDDEHPLCSLKIWKKVKEFINERNWKSANMEKASIEESQRKKTEAVDPQFFCKALSPQESIIKNDSLSKVYSDHDQQLTEKFQQLCLWKYKYEKTK